MQLNIDKLKLAFGDYPDFIPDLKFGTADVGVNITTIWSGASTLRPGLYTYPDTDGEIMYLSSDDVDDVNGGAGLWSVSIHGLDENNDPQSESVLLNGQTQVPTVGKYRRVHRVSGIHGNTSAGAQGDIYLGATGATLGVPTGNIYAHMDHGFEGNQTQMAIRTVPRGYRMAIFSFYLGTHQDKKTTIYGAARNGLEANSVWHSAFNQNFQGFSGDMNFPFVSSHDEGTDIEVRAMTDVGTEDVTASFVYLFGKKKS